jgi:hypothetical protein
MMARAQAEAALQRHYGFPPTEADWQDEDGRPGIGRAVEDAIAAAARDAERAALERAARLCVRRSVSWSRYDDDQPAEYRRGVEETASQLAAAIRALAPAADGGSGTVVTLSDDDLLTVFVCLNEFAARNPNGAAAKALRVIGPLGQQALNRQTAAAPRPESAP